MSNLIDVNKLQNILPEFLDTRVIPSAPSVMKFLIGGATPLVLSRLSDMIQLYLPYLKALGIIIEDNGSLKFDIDQLKVFLNSGFDKSGKIELYGFLFDKSDGEALINIMEKYK